MFLEKKITHSSITGSEFSLWSVKWFFFSLCAYSLYDVKSDTVCACMFSKLRRKCVWHKLSAHNAHPHAVCPFRDVKLPSFVQSNEVCEQKGKWMFWWKQCSQMIKGLFAYMCFGDDFTDFWWHTWLVNVCMVRTHKLTRGPQVIQVCIFACKMWEIQ